MPQTNKQKYNELLDILKDREQEFVDSTIGKDAPKSFWIISVNYTAHQCGYFIEEKIISKIRYHSQFYIPDRPTLVDIEKLQEFLANPVFESSRIRACWVSGNISGSARYSDIGTDEFSAWEKDKLEPKLANMIEIYSPKEGYSPCAYCGKQRKPEDMMHGTIFSRNWKANNFKSPPRLYCKDAPCHGNDQMAHEG